MDYQLDKQHKYGKLHAIERIRCLLDKGSFFEIGQSINGIKKDSSYEMIPYDGVITGYGKINGKKVYIYSQDYTVNGGTLGIKHGEKIVNILKRAILDRCPIIGINDSGGARIQEGLDSLKGYGDIFYYQVLASGYIPQISVIAGTCAGGAVYSPALTDFIFVIKNISKMFVTGPQVLRESTGKEVSSEDLGGITVHGKESGVAHFIMESEEECYNMIRKVLDMIPHSNKYTYKGSYLSIVRKNNARFSELVPKNKRLPYDVKKVIYEICDKGSFLEIQGSYATNIVIGLGKICDGIVGIIANQPMSKAGVLDSDSSVKAARFIRYCDCFNIPIVTLVDTPGFMPSESEEKRGIIRHGAKLITAYAEAHIPKITVILRKAYGGAYITMGSKHLHADFVFSWPNAEIAIMGSESAINILYQKELRKCDNENGRDTFIKNKIKDYESKYINSNIALNEGYIDAEIEPAETTFQIAEALRITSNKEYIDAISKKHTNIPL